MKTKTIILSIIILVVFTLMACTAPAASSTISTKSIPTTSTQAPTSSAEAKPQGELVAALQDFGNENFIPWASDTSSSSINLIFYDMLIYFDETNVKYIPGLAESWEVSPDALTVTYNLRKGVQFQDGWGEFTSADLKYNFEKHAGKDSVGQFVAARQIMSMDTPDPYTIIVYMKTPQPIFWTVFSMGNGGVCQGIVSKKYVETVGEKVASQKPIGTGPYKLVESKLASYYKFEALDTHWRVVPEFKTLIVRLVPEVNTTMAMLKNKEIDLARVPAEQMADLKANGLAAEASTTGGGNAGISWGGIAIPEDPRYDPAIHNKDPWADVRVRKAMALAIDRQAICNTIFASGAFPSGVPLFSADMDKYQYPYDPATARQLLKDAGYPNGFSFQAISYVLRGTPETPRLVEALVGYWQQIGLDPKIVSFDYAAYSASHRNTFQNAGEIAVVRLTKKADMLNQAALHLMPGAMNFQFMDEESYAIWQEGNVKLDFNERDEYVNKLNKYYYDTYYGSLIVISYCYAWNSDKVAPFAHQSGDSPRYLEYVRHAQPLNTFRLFTPMPGR